MSWSRDHQFFLDVKNGKVHQKSYCLTLSDDEEDMLKGSDFLVKTITYKHSRRKAIRLSQYNERFKGQDLVLIKPYTGPAIFGFSHGQSAVLCIMQALLAMPKCRGYYLKKAYDKLVSPRKEA